MKVICVGGGLAGFTASNHAKTPSNLKQMLQPGERVVLVCHGPPYVMLNGPDSELAPELRDYSIHAVLLAHTADPAASTELKDLKNDLRDQCDRVLGVTQGWNKIAADTRVQILDFLTSNDAEPRNLEVRILLGYYSPLTRLSMRIALEIALRELETPSEVNRPAMSQAELLAPALAIAQAQPSLDELVPLIEDAVKSDPKTLRKFVSQALNQLRN